MQVAVAVAVVLTISREYLVYVRANIVFVVVTVTLLGVTVVVGLMVVDGLVTVTGAKVVNVVSVVVLVALMIGVTTAVAVTVGVYVLVDCGPTVREKSRSYAIGSPLPLLLRIRTDQSPDQSWSLSSGQVDN
jgi:hypothetical protein